MWLFKTIIFLFLPVFVSSSCSARGVNLRAERYFISASPDSLSKEYGSWALHVMKGRMQDEIVFAKNGSETQEGDQVLYLSINPNSAYNYCVQVNKNTISLTGKNPEDGKWLFYQYLESLGKTENRIRTDDLPPATATFKNECKTFDFEYREPFLPTNLTVDNAEIFGTNSLDRDWGLWGHNLNKIVVPHEEDYAFWQEERNPKQYCFSSSNLLDQISSFIRDNFGDGSHMSFRFMIMPNDNDIVCTCDRCVAEGNSTKNATPAVAAFVTQLAKRFPNHVFFTSAYRTTQRPPKDILPLNIGVFVSTMNLPQAVPLSDGKKEVKEFASLLEEWETKTSHLFVWDYLGNFDDYLTPAPGLWALPQRLSFFRTHGATGIFLNSSGYDYSTLEDMKTYVAAELMRDSSCDMKILIQKYLKKFYPIHAEDIASYWIGLEEDFYKSQKTFDQYGGMIENLDSYLDEKELTKLYDKVKSSKNPENPDERSKRLTIALAFSKLQIAYSLPKKYFQIKKDSLIPSEGILVSLEDIKAYRSVQHLTSYREENGNLDDYLKFYKESVRKTKNKFLGTNVTATPGGNTFLITDGLNGNPQDYHMGWFISNTDLELNLYSPVSGTRTIQIRFLINEKHRFSAPQSLYVRINNKEIDLNLTLSEEGNIATIQFPIILHKKDHIEIFIKKKLGPTNNLALDEIRVL